MKFRGNSLIALATPVGVILLVAVVLELASVVRLVTERTVAECDLVSMEIARQLELLMTEQPGAPLGRLAEDPRLQTVLSDAIIHAPSILAVAVYDTAGVAVAHSVEDELGERIDEHPPLPVAEDLLESFGVLWRLWHSGRVYALTTPLTVDDRPFASIQVTVFGTFLWDHVRGAFLRGVAVAVLLIAATIGVGLYLSRRAIDRVRGLRDGIAAIRAGRFDSELPVTGADAFSQLARELNLLAEQFQEARREHGAEVTFQRAADLFGEGFLMLGADNEVLVANDVACRRLGVDRGAIIGRRLDACIPADHPAVQLSAKLRETDERALTVRLPERDGAGELVAVGHRIDDPDRRRAGILIEIKERREQAMLHDLVDQSRLLGRYREISAGMAHELRGPLQNISFEIDAIVTSAETEETRERARNALRGVKRLDRAISGFLKIARLRAPSLEQTDCRELLQEIAGRLTPEVNLAGMELDLELPDELPTALADREALGQAIENLVRNATQAQPSRTSTITLRAEAAQHSLHIAVVDTGPGIPAHVVDKVFDPFFTTREDGSGIGLSLVRQTVEALDGKVGLDTRPNAGTTVTIQLPLLAPLEVEEAR